VVIRFTIAEAQAANVALETARDLESGPSVWQPDSAAVITHIAADTFEVRSMTGGDARRFYRLTSPPP
jgi:hypothetical protein